MSIRKTIVVFAVACCLLATLAACGKTAPVDPEADHISPEDGQRENVVAVVNGRDVTMEEFEYFVRYNVDARSNNGETINDWEEEVSDGVTVSDSVKEDALKWFIYAAGIWQQASRMEIDLTEEDQIALDEQWQQFISGYGSQEAAEEALAAVHCTPELYRYILETQYMGDRVFDSLYGKYGRDLPDAQCAAMTENDGYLMAKHILLLTVKTNDDGTREELPEEEKAAKMDTIRELKARIDGAADGEREALFDELMQEYSEDTGLPAYPDGYLFQEGDMVDEFYEGTLALEEGGVSDVVETTYGYHLIMRIPINYDVIPSAYSMYTAYGYDYLTLRYLCADEAFGVSAQQWMERVEVEKTDLFDTISVADMIMEEK